VRIARGKIFNPAGIAGVELTPADALTRFRQCLDSGRNALENYHLNGASAQDIVFTHAWLIDQLLRSVWHYAQTGSNATSPAALIATGGYGRGELHPGSDIDLLILFERKPETAQTRLIEAFIRLLWDIGLEVGHSVRTLRDCSEQAARDITVITNLMESRLILGEEYLLERMYERIRPGKMWPARKFFQAKVSEQIARHARYNDTAYNLEPHLKEGPGGLRDIQTIQWVAQRYFGTSNLHDLSEHGFLTEEEVRTLVRGRNLLWRLRNALHFLSGRSEDRLLFDFQHEIARQLHYQDSAELAVEKLMKRFYRTVKELRVLNEILLQHFEEAILHPGKRRTLRINRRFRAVDGFLELARADVFSRQPFAIMEAFALLQQDHRLRGIRASTIRHIQASIPLIDTAFRQDIRCRSLFLEIIKAAGGQTRILRRMNAYGILGAYIPQFGRVVGQMQHDLFHVYTIDAHLLFVLRNLRRLEVPEHAGELPFCSSLMQSLFKKHRLYLAALFHDVAKGRGGDHSALGELDAYRFCKLHDLSEYDAHLVAWLVRKHLLMSWVAQRQDISDPQVIDRFANEVGDQDHLDNLYLLTVADIRGTGPQVWNEWKGKLLMDLYNETTRALRRGTGSPIQLDEKMADLKQEALAAMHADARTIAAAQKFWQLLDSDYFVRNTPESIAWHATALLNAKAAELPLVDARADPSSGTLRVFICSADSDRLLADVTAGFDRLNMNIVDARVHRLQSNLLMLMFVVLLGPGYTHGAAAQEKRLSRIRAQILNPEPARDPGQVKLPRTLKHFPIATTVRFTDLPSGGSTVMEVVAQDRPGLLYQVANALLSSKIRLVTAKVGTFGARAEDIFYITDRDDRPVRDPAQRARVARKIVQALPASNTS